MIGRLSPLSAPSKAEDCPGMTGHPAALAQRRRVVAGPTEWRSATRRRMRSAPFAQNTKEFQ